MNDLLLAQRIVAYGNKKDKLYHDSSFIYMTTNEKINLYQGLLTNRNKILSIASSGDQILNTILEGTYQIDAYDISRFPKYFIELKKAGILALTKEEFIDFFFIVDFHKDEYYDDLYFKISDFLKDEYKDFWDGLLNAYDWSSITHSPLFSSQTVNLDIILQNNNYLRDFDTMKQMAINSNIHYITGDIFDIAISSKTNYDFINLSSILYYCKDYRKLLHNLPLTETGIALSYLYSVPQEMIDAYPECTFLPFDNCKEGIMLYQKKKS